MNTRSRNGTIKPSKSSHRTSAERLKRLATAFRTAILKWNRRKLSPLFVGLANFPKGDYTGFCYLLGHYLKEMGIEGVQYVFGMTEQGKGHAWLEVDNIILDITASRFDQQKQSLLSG